MLYRVISVSRVVRVVLLALLVLLHPLFTHAQTTTNIRIMSANLNGDAQSYQPFAIRIFQGLKPDIVAIQEFKYSNSTTADLRSFVNTAFGTNFNYYREPFTGNGDLPNGIISRYPIINAGSWTDNSVANRGFAWAQIDLPGTNDLYVVSVHLLTSSATDRGTEAVQLKGLMQANFPANAWIVLAGDFNTGSRNEAAITTFNGYLSDQPIPTDNNGVSFTNGKRNAPHDYVLPSLSFTNVETASVFPSHSFPNGLVFDSQVYSPLSDVAPVQFLDTTNAQHMAVIKDFLVSGALNTDTNAPAITAQPLSQTVPAGTNVTLSVTASGATPLSYQWFFNTNNLISGATANTLNITNAQSTDTGAYSVIITNANGSITSSFAILTVTNTAPIIVAQPQNQSVFPGDTATFSTSASGTAPLSYQWFFNTNTAISGATSNTFILTNAQSTNAGSYFVVIANSAGSVTSKVATLAINNSSASSVIAQWNFNGSTTAPSLGSGTASLVGGTTATFAGGDTTRDPAGNNGNSGWNTTTYPAQGSGNKTRGVQFNVSTAGKQNIVIAWSSQCSNTGSKYGRLQYSTNGTTFFDFTTAFTNGTSFAPVTNNLSAFAGVNNNPNFAIRLVSEFESTAIGDASASYTPANSGSTYGTAGTMRYDMVTVLGAAITTTPAAPAILSSSTASSGNQFLLNVTGTAGSNYIIQVSTNLSASNWISIFTNTAPFTFTNPDTATPPQSFYRAIAQ